MTLKNRLVSLETPADVTAALAEQAQAVREQITSLSQVLQTLEKLCEETRQMQTVDWKKYADIVVNLQMKSEHYWMVKHLDNETLDMLSNHFDAGSATTMTDSIVRLLDTAEQYQKDGVLPESDKGQMFAKTFWDTMIEVSNGDMGMLIKLMQAGNTAINKEWGEKQKFVKGFIEPALAFYFISNGINPFEGGQV